MYGDLQRCGSFEVVKEVPLWEQKKRDSGEEYGRYDVKGDFRLAWMWIEGRRARLRAAGDVVERERWMDESGGRKSVHVVNPLKGVG